jgi:uncharacterized protein
MINADLQKLLDLQKIDQIIDGFHAHLEKLPQEIEEKKLLIQQANAQIEEEKKKLTNLQLRKKEKEIEVSTQEEKVKKNEKELNSVKSNEAYKGLLTEIDAAKKQKEQTEDEILTIMLELDQVNKELKGFEVDIKQKQQKIENEIKEKEEEIKKIQGLLEDESKKRNEFAVQIPKDIFTRYDFIRNRKKTFAIATIVGENCSGCHTLLTQSTINEVRKGKELVVCDSCARILCHPDVKIAESASS